MGTRCESMAGRDEQILRALGRIEDRLKTIDERITALELANAVEKATKEEVVLIRESLIETRAQLLTTDLELILKRPPVPIPEPGPFDVTLEDF